LPCYFVLIFCSFNKEPIKKFKKESASDWTAEEVEAGLVEYFVGSYLRLITTLRLDLTNIIKYYINQRLLHALYVMP